MLKYVPYILHFTKARYYKNETTIIVKQNCFWKIVVRRTQDVRSMASINPYAEEKEHFLFAYDAPRVFQIHFCLTINPNW